MDRFQDGLFACVLTLCILLVLSCQSEGTGTCKDGVCAGFSQGVADETIEFRPTGGWYIPGDLTTPSSLEYIAKMLSDQRKYGPEITAQDILDLVGEAVDEKRRRETL